MTKPQPRKAMYVNNIPPNLHGFFKAYCAKRGLTMHDVMVKLMKKFVKGEITIT